MFKKLFTKEPSVVSSANPQGGANSSPSRPMTTEGEMMMEEDPKRQFWKNLSTTKGLNKMFRRLRDVYKNLPPHFSNRIKEIDFSLALTVVESHKMLVLILNELFNQNQDNKLFLEQSQDWETWYTKLERLGVEYRKNVKEMMRDLVGMLNYEGKDTGRLNALVEAKPGDIEQLTGLDKIEDIKSNLIDVAVLLGRESESRIVQNILDEPVRVGPVLTRTSSTASSTISTTSRRLCHLPALGCAKRSKGLGKCYLPVWTRMRSPLSLKAGLLV